MKNLFRSPLIPALIVAILLPAMVNFFQNRSLGRSLTALNGKVGELDQKITKLAPAANDSVITALGSLREELIKYRAEQVGRDQILGLGGSSGSSNTSDPYADLSMSLDQALATIERQTNTLATPTPTPTPTKQAKLKSGWKSVDAFEKPQASSKIIGQISTNQSYQILANQNNWYQLGLSANLSGWVQSQFIDETNY